MNTLSLCMIIKNEEDFLDQCLAWHKDLVNEIVIIDTGSTDRSKEIAQKYTSKIYDFKWCDDFSAARNYSLSFATKDWILVLDADELIDKADQNKILQLINSTSNEAYQFNQRTYTNDVSLYGLKILDKNCADLPGLSSQSKPKGYLDIPIVRLIPNQNELGLRYVQRIHEGIEYQDTSKKPVLTDIVLHHWGALRKEERLSEKKRFYYNLEKIRFSENNQDAEGLRQYATACLEFKEYEKALEAFELAQKINPKHVYDYFGKAHAYYHLKKFSACEESLKLALDIEPTNIYLSRFLALLLLEENKISEAETLFKNYLNTYPDDVILRSQFVSRYMNKGHLKSALALLDKIFSLNPLHEDSLYNAGILFYHLGNKESALEMMKKLLQLKPDDVEVKNKIDKWTTELCSN